MENAASKLFNPKQVTFDIGDGREVMIETGKLAKQADGSVVVRMGNTMLLATVVSAKEMREGQDFFPLSVDFQEKFAAAGRIPGGFLRREGRLSDHEILTSRLVDRALRPMFADGYLNETQVIISLISYDENVEPDALAALAASAALSVSDIPFMGPISEVRVARIDGEFVLNPSREALKTADMEIMLAADMKNVLMVEGEMNEVQEADLVAAIKFGHEAIKTQCQAQLDLVAAVGAKEKRAVVTAEINEELMAQIETFAYDKICAVVKEGIADKHARKNAFKAIKTAFVETLGEDVDPAIAGLVSGYFGKVEKKAIRATMISEKTRLDGRQPAEIRPIAVDLDYLPSAHGSSVFTRGETQSLTTVTLGTKMDEQMIDNATLQDKVDFMLHYNFPPFSTGETKPLRGPGRREVGHGTLANRSLRGVIPSKDKNPYTIRIVSDILESNGSSSMATVCAGSLALHDAGIPVKTHVSGIAMGLISDDAGNVVVLSDILGDEDHLGDMDFKVTGTRDGICACQMDIKIDGLPYEVLISALNQAKEGRLHILDIMHDAIDTPREDMKPHAPRIEKMMINKEFIGAVIGPGGKVIQEIQAETKTVIHIEEVGDKGEIVISGNSKDAIDGAVNTIKAIASVPEIGEEYEATVKSIMPYGAFVEFMPNKEGLLHISEISWKRLESMDGVLATGDKVKVKLLDIDKRSGKVKLSRKALLPRPPKPAPKAESAE